MKFLIIIVAWSGALITLGIATDVSGKPRMIDGDKLEPPL